MNLFDRIAQASFGRARVPEVPQQAQQTMISASWRVWAWNEAARIGSPDRDAFQVQIDADRLLSWVFATPASAMSAREGQDPQGLEAKPASATAESRDAQPLSTPSNGEPA